MKWYTVVIIIIVVILVLGGANSAGGLAGGKSMKKATMAALNMDLVKGGYKAYKKIKGN